MSIGLNKVVNKENSICFARTTKEVMKVQIFFDSFKQYFIDLLKLGKYIMKREK